MTEVAIPMDQGVIRLDDLESVGTAALGGHGDDVDDVDDCEAPAEEGSWHGDVERNAARTRKGLTQPSKALSVFPLSFLFFRVFLSQLPA